MSTNRIIANAATVLVVVNELGETDLNGLQNRTKLDSKSIYLALGWLLRGSNVLLDYKADRLLIARGR